jgi:hypothetical protein
LAQFASKNFKAKERVFFATLATNSRAIAFEGGLDVTPNAIPA